ncbi:MAG: Holliday junction resolvase RuvX [Granulosicoccus sp.]
MSDSCLPGPDAASAPHGTCMAFDYGSRRIGVAVGETLTGTTQPLSIVGNTNGTPDWQSIDKLLAEWQPVLLVVGWPLTVSGEEQDITAHVRGFIKKLVSRTALPVFAADERFSSMAAQTELKRQRSSGQRRRKTSHADVDTLAAALILENWFKKRVAKKRSLHTDKLHAPSPPDTSNR